MGRKNKNVTFWEAKNARASVGEFFPKLSSEISCEVCVIGAGITGVTLAYLLAEKGIDVVMLEADVIGSGTTGGSSAHLDPLTDSKLRELINNFGIEEAKKIINANVEALNLIESLVKKHAIDCDFERVPGVYLAETESEANALLDEQAAAVSLGLDAELESDPSSPFVCKARLVYDIHARFDPLKYVFELAKAAKRSGARIYQMSRVDDIENGAARVEAGAVKAKHFALATHMPFGFHPILQSKVFAFRSYVIGARVSKEVEDALFWDLKEPYHYIRKAEDSQGELLIIGGADHRTGHKSHDPFGRLINYAQERFDVLSIDYAWSAQFYLSADGMPYIGKIQSEDNLWVATGYEGNGLTFGTAAARLLRDLILEQSNALEQTFSPSRLHISTSAKKLLSENFSSAKDFVGDRLSRTKKTPQELEPGEGAIVSHHGDQLACYKDQEGGLHAMSPVCPHSKCHVRWNGVEESWDCPCHGGRFSATGELINGPPTRNLKKVDVLFSAPEEGASP